jgi:hypothetical protein
LQRFCEAVTAASEPTSIREPPRFTPGRRKQIEAAERRLVAAGI